MGNTKSTYIAPDFCRYCYHPPHWVGWGVTTECCPIFESPPMIYAPQWFWQPSIFKFNNDCVLLQKFDFSRRPINKSLNPHVRNQIDKNTTESTDLLLRHPLGKNLLHKNGEIVPTKVSFLHTIVTPRSGVESDWTHLWRFIDSESVSWVFFTPCHGNQQPSFLGIITHILGV